MISGIVVINQFNSKCYKIDQNQINVYIQVMELGTMELNDAL